MSAVSEFFRDYPVIWRILQAWMLSGFILSLPIALVWLERKVAGFVQSRLGPVHVGKHGILQTVADTVKLLLKEDTTPTDADKRLFYLAPYLSFIATLLAFMALPFAPGWVVLDIPVALLFILGVSLFNVVGILMAGWASNNKYSLLGGLRAVAQLLAYEIPMTLAILCVVLYSGSLSLTEIVQQQASAGWNILNPLLILAFLLYFLCALAEVNRTPFDLSEAESELVSGFNTEYSGMRFAMFFAAEFANNFFVAALAVSLFFGGWSGPVLPPLVWFLLKTFLLVFIMVWVRWTPPRLRVDQMLKFSWQFLVPVGLLNLLLMLLFV